MLLHKDITDKIIKAYYNVYNTLGYGFLEKVYENAMMIELQKQGLHVQKQMPIKVFYENQLVGEYYTDILVDETVIVELKTPKTLCEEHEFQLLNYLKATEFGLLLNFGKEPQFKRKIFTN